MFHFQVLREEPVERRVPQVKAMYAYKGQGMEVAKGEVNAPLHSYFIVR